MRKIKKLIATFCIFSVSLLTSCSGYNFIMIRHLSNRENYLTYIVTINNISSFNTDSEKVYIDVIFETKEEVADFKGVSPENLLDAPQDYIITVVVNGDNVDELCKTEFKKDVSIGDNVSITVSNWIYMDSNFFYVIGIEMNDVVYLEPKKGLENVIALMESNKSLL